MNIKPLVIAALSMSIAACGSSPNGTSDDAEHAARTERPIATPAPERRAETTPPVTPRPTMAETDTRPATTAGPDARILSILHEMNQQEIQMGRLAQERGASDDVKSYGEMLVRDHAANDMLVLQTAAEGNITFLDPQQVSDALTGERGVPPAHTAHMDRLSQLEGADFDRTFAEHALAGHRELIQIIEKARPSVRDAAIGDLLDKTLPTIREHERMAAALVNR